MAVGSWWRARTLLEQDGLLYVASATFAVWNLPDGLDDYRFWAGVAAISYALAGAIAVASSRTSRVGRDPIAARRVRRGIAALCFLGAAVLPLGAEIAWRSDGAAGAHAQPEIAVIERAGDRVAGGAHPYPTHPTTVGVAPSTDAHTVDATSYFPYLPGMILFGLPNATGLPAALGDARVVLALFVLIGAAVAVALVGPSRPRLRMLEVLFVLPTGALPLATGGDDLSVIVLLLIGYLCATRRVPVASGLAFGAAATLKFLAWPVALFVLVVVRDRDGNPARGRFGVAFGGMLAACLAYGLASDPVPFIDNAFRFPLGLTKLASPAASPLLGHEIASLFPGHRTLIAGMMALLAVVVCVGYLRRFPLLTVADAARASAVALLLATVLAPTTRFGYLIYVANLLVWSVLLTARGEPVLPATEDASAHDRRWSRAEADDAWGSATTS